MNLSYDIKMEELEKQLFLEYLKKEEYIIPEEELILNKKKEKELIKLLKKQNFKLFDYKLNNKYADYKILKNDSHIILLNYMEDLVIKIYSKSFEAHEKLLNNIHSFLENLNNEEVSLYFKEYLFNEAKTSIYSNENLIELKELDYINENYYPFIKIDKFINYFMKSNSNILILSGEPGLGKTKFIDLILKKTANKFEDFFKIDEEEEKYINVIYVKDNLVLSNQKFWKEIEKYKQNFLVLDDIDFSMLSKRNSTDDYDKSQFISSLLSFSDGLIKNNCKIIITTNQKIDSIDSALLRDGRLFAIIEFRPLKKEEAKKIWLNENLDEESFEKIFKNKKNIIQSTLSKEINIKKNFKEEFSLNDIIEKELNILDKLNNEKIGFI